MVEAGRGRVEGASAAYGVRGEGVGRTPPWIMLTVWTSRGAGRGVAMVDEFAFIGQGVLISEEERRKRRRGRQRRCVRFKQLGLDKVTFLHRPHPHPHPHLLQRQHHGPTRQMVHGSVSTGVAASISQTPPRRLPVPWPQEALYALFVCMGWGDEARETLAPATTTTRKRAGSTARMMDVVVIVPSMTLTSTAPVEFVAVVVVVGVVGVAVKAAARVPQFGGGSFQSTRQGDGVARPLAASAMCRGRWHGRRRHI